MIDGDGTDGDKYLFSRRPWGVNLGVLQYVTLAVLIENDGLQLSSSDSASLEGPESIAKLYRVMVAFPTLAGHNIGKWRRFYIESQTEDNKKSAG